ncbi:GNAT family N-acetyltransferase [Aquibacillus kalidii]|uniref:GNAT family N-acetyltransferase n=1 Tax=Aquibacillus kalidii TaxID=2762597 RepID=UPI001F2EB504|nr:hypothetical protein [Aquibacillus kalidii]
MIEIRLASIEDAEALALIKHEIVTSTDFYLRTPQDPRETTEDYKRKIIQKQQNDGLTIVAVENIDNTKIVGFLSFSRPTYQRINHTGSFGMGIKNSSETKELEQSCCHTL